jgi:hypothetical protein
MSVRARRKELGKLAKQIDGGTPLTKEQLRWLSGVCARIGSGESADSVLGLVGKRGERKSAEAAKELLDFVLFHVAGQIENGVASDDAFHAGVRLQRRLHGLDPDDPDDRYSIENLRRMARKYPAKLRPIRKTGDDDSAL